MAWIKNKPTRPPEQLTALRIEFTGEQDLPPERELKKRFVELFDTLGTVERSYLARVDYGHGMPWATGVHVALCLRCASEHERLRLEVGTIFAETFGSHEHLDIVFIDDEQEQRLRQVCLPFYPAG